MKSKILIVNALVFLAAFASNAMAAGCGDAAKKVNQAEERVGNIAFEYVRMANSGANYEELQKFYKEVELPAMGAAAEAREALEHCRD